jgi:RNase P/RNase MRP subunit p29
MQRIKVLGLALVAVFAMSAVVSASALAAGEGEFVKAGTTVELSKKLFTGVNVGSTILETVGGSKVECKNLSTTGGKVNGKETGEETVHFLECTSTFGVGCEGGVGHKAKEIIVPVTTQTRKNVGKTKVLLEVKVAEFTFTCFGTEIKVKGSFLVSTGTPKTPKTKFSYTANQTKGKQEITEYETSGGTKVTGVSLESKVAGGAFEKSGQGGTEEVTYEEAGEYIV